MTKRRADSEYFSSIKKIEFDPSGKNPLSFKYYNPEQLVLGKKMKNWLRFSVCYWHTFRGTGADPFGEATLSRPWDNDNATTNEQQMDLAITRLRVSFEFMKKLGVEYWTFHDRDIAPVGKTLAETNVNLDKITDLALELQKETGIKLLWGTQNLFSHKMYACGAATAPEAHVFAAACAQIKKVLDISLKLGAENIVFWGGREGFSSILNTDIKRELDHMALIFKMALNYKKKIGATYQFLIEPKPREPMKHQYDYDAQTVIGFLHTYGLQNDFKLNIEPNHTTLAGHDYEHDIVVASLYGMLGSIDANTGDPSLGWDTDQFPMDVKKTTLVMDTVIKQGGLGKGGLNFDCKVRRESNEVEDLFIAHIGAMDSFALGLLKAAGLNETLIPGMVKKRYSSFDSGFGQKIEKGLVDLEECEAYILKNGLPSKAASGKQELYELLYNRHLH